MRVWRVRNRTASLILFLLRTYFLNPLNNPVFAVFAAALAFFAVDGSLDRYHVALVLYLGVLSHLFVGNLFGTGGARVAEGERLPLMHFFQALPLARKKIFSAYFVSILIYMTLFALAFGLVLVRLMGLPDIEPIDYVQSIGPEGDTITTLRGFVYSPRGIPSFVAITLEKSMLFDLIGRSVAIKLMAIFYYGSAFLYIFILHGWRRFSRPTVSPLRNLFHRLPLAFLFGLGILFAAELVLTQKEVGMWTRTLIEHADGAAMVVVAMTALTLISVVDMSRSIVRELEGGR